MPTPFRLRLRSCLALLAAAAAVACSPTFNWRDVPVGDGGLMALLPCKAERSQREVALDGGTATVQVAGCQTGGATFAVAVAAADSVAQAQAWLAAWSASARDPGAGRTCLQPARVLRAAVAPPALERDTACAAEAPPGRPHQLWFAQTHGDKVLLYQATLLDGPAEPEVWRTFAEGLRLP